MAQRTWLTAPRALLVLAALGPLAVLDTVADDSNWRQSQWQWSAGHHAGNSGGGSTAHVHISVRGSGGADKVFRAGSHSALERAFDKRHLTDTAKAMLEDYGPRQVYAIRRNYYDGCPVQREKIRACAAESNIDLQSRWTGMEPAGVKVLFVGNSYMLQIKQALVLRIDDSAITNELYILPSNSTRTNICRGCPCIIYPEGQGHVSGSCNPVDVRAMGIKPGLICDTRNPSDDDSKGNTEVPFWCIDSVSKVQLTDGSTLATVKNVAQMNFKEGIRDAAAAMDVHLKEIDVIIANEGNDPTFNLDKCIKCHGEREFDRFMGLLRHAVKRYDPGDHIVRPIELLSSLKRHRFKGTLLYINNMPWEDIPEEVHRRWRQAIEEVKPTFKVLPYELMSPTLDPEVKACGNVCCHGGHHVMPGQPSIRARLLRDKIASVMEGREPISVAKARKEGL